jgi:hypothetical protein
MAKAILEFDLTDSDDRMEHLRAIKSLDMAMMLWELFYNTKKEFMRELESNEDSSDREFQLVEKIWDRIWELGEERGIKIDDLVV